MPVPQDASPVQPVKPAHSAFYTGVIAALLATVAMLVLGRLFNGPIPPQLIGDRLTDILPLSVFAKIMGSLGASAKATLFAGAIVGQFIVGGLLAIAVDRMVKRGIKLGAIFAGLLIGIWLFLGIIIAPIGSIGVFGARATVGVSTTAICFGIAALIYAGITTLGLAEAGGREREMDDGRRQLLRYISFGVPSLLAVVYLGRFGLKLAQKSAAAPADQSDGELPSAITPTGEFYIVSKNILDPSVKVDNWSLKVDGQVDHPATFSYQELRARPAVKRITTLECISNDVGGHYISTGEWTGFSLPDFLKQAGVRSSTSLMEMHAVDGYTESIPIAVAMHPDNMLVYDLNGAPLPEVHGYPLRLIVPGRFGMKNVKWINEIKLIDTDFNGYWEQRGWDKQAIVTTMSRIDVPSYGAHVPLGQASLLGGIAFSGDRGISKVEVSDDDGQTWQVADLQPPLSPLTWVYWTKHWMPQKLGSTSIVVRAWDGTGTVQTGTYADPLPSGATGYDRITVTVVKGSDLATPAATTGSSQPGSQAAAGVWKPGGAPAPNSAAGGMTP